MSFSSLTPGTRVLANWSPKLRGLFPGTVTEGASPEPGMLYVEFDDGDSGYMRLEGIRMLPANYPTVGEWRQWVRGRGRRSGKELVPVDWRGG